MNIDELYDLLRKSAHLASVSHLARILEENKIIPVNTNATKVPEITVTELHEKYIVVKATYFYNTPEEINKKASALFVICSYGSTPKFKSAI